MEWTILYISGKSYFMKDMLARLEQSGIVCMPGTSDRDNVSIIWVDESVKLRDFKLAIGAKLIFKYRLRFSTDPEMLEEQKTDAFTPREKELIAKMKSWENTQRKE